MARSTIVAAAIFIVHAKASAVYAGAQTGSRARAQGGAGAGAGTGARASSAAGIAIIARSFIAARGSRSTRWRQSWWRSEVGTRAVRARRWRTSATVSVSAVNTVSVKIRQCSCLGVFDATIHNLALVRAGA